MRRIYDASRPSKKPPPWWVCGFYIAGETPHVWSDGEIKDDPARFGLPIGVHIGQDSALDGGTLAADMITWLEARRIPRGSHAVIDTEDIVYTPFLAAADAKFIQAGYKLINYGSLNAIVHNYLPHGGRWGAAWDGIQRLDNIPGEVADQFANAAMLRTDYNASVIEDAVTLWEKRPLVPPVFASWEEDVEERVTSALNDLSVAHSIITAHLP